LQLGGGSYVKPVVFLDKPEHAKKSCGAMRSIEEMNAALGEGCPFHYEQVPAIKEIAVGENAVDKVVVVDEDSPPVLALVFNDLHMGDAPLNSLYLDYLKGIHD
jgi:hypothetical protein